jgi:hypothetical protein
MNPMKDRNGKVIHDGELIIIVNRPDIFTREFWTVFDCIGTNFILRNACTNEIKFVEQKDIQRTY